MLEVLMEKNKKMFLEFFRIEPKKFFMKRLLVASLFLITFIVLIYAFDEIKLLAVAPFVLLLGYKIPYMELISRKKRSDIIKQYMFPTFLRYFISLIDTQGNVYQTLKAVSKYIDDPIKTELDKLIKKLEENNVNNRDAFMEFAEYIGSSEAHMIMNMIFEFNESGINKNDLLELENTLVHLQENKTNELIEYKVNSLGKHANPVLVYSLSYIFAFTAIVFVSYFKILNL